MQGRHGRVQERPAAYAEPPRPPPHEGSAGHVRSLILGDRNVAVALAILRGREHECDRGSGRSEALPAGRSASPGWPLRPTLRLGQMRSRRVVDACGPVMLQAVTPPRSPLHAGQRAGERASQRVRAESRSARWETSRPSAILAAAVITSRIRESVSRWPSESPIDTMRVPITAPEARVIKVRMRIPSISSPENQATWRPPGSVYAPTYGTETRYSTTASAGTVALILFVVDEVRFVQTFKSLY